METVEDNRFERVKLILGDEGLTALRKSTVMVLGLGGVGSNCVEALARGGVGTLILIDMDVVDYTNINRQAIAFTSTVGRPKAEVMAEMVHDINPACQVYAEQQELDQQNIPTYLSQFPRPDYVIDCIDLVLSKAALAAWAQAEGLPLLVAMGAANKLDPLRFQFTDIHQTYNCPLAKKMRQEYRKFGVGEVEVLFSDELPRKVDNPVSTARSHTLGTMSYMPPILGQMLAGKVIRRLSHFEAMP